MLCFSLAALLALTLYEVFLLPIKKGTVRGKTNHGEQGGKAKVNKSENRHGMFGTSRPDVCVIFVGAVNDGTNFVRECRAECPRQIKKFSCKISRQISHLFGTANRFSSLLAQRLWNLEKLENP